MSKIGNDVCQVPSGIELNEKDYATCLLTTLKDMEKNYAIAMTEASNDFLYNIYEDIFLKISHLQRELYVVMFQKGWYQLENVETKKLKEKYTLFNSDFKSLND